MKKSAQTTVHSPSTLAGTVRLRCSLRTGSAPTGRPRIEELLVRPDEPPLSLPLSASGDLDWAAPAGSAGEPFGDGRVAPATRCRNDRNTGCVQCASRRAMRDPSNVHMACSTGRPTQKTTSGAPVCRHQARTVQSRETTRSADAQIHMRQTNSKLSVRSFRLFRIQRARRSDRALT